MFEIPYYHDYISRELAAFLLKEARAVSGVPGLSEVGRGGGLETPDALRFLTALYDALKGDLHSTLQQRIADRKFIDERVRACSEFNETLNREITDSDYQTVIGLEDSNGRVVIGPLQQNYAGKGGQPIAPIPDFLQGPHVTLFGPPDSAKMAINAMNSFHRRISSEPPIVEELLGSTTDAPKWGADDEDSKTPLRADLVDAAVNLTACFEGNLKVDDGNAGKKYELAGDRLALPIKRFPGLALPSTFLFYKNNPIPLHLYDFALHLFRNWQNPEALVFYVPKLENEEEATYIHKMVATAEKMVKEIHSSYVLGSVRLMIVLENPRAILRTHEIMDKLHPYFVGASLGWHDYLASTARLFKEDHHYRIPVKSDPDIVIKYIKASHLLLSDVVGSRGGIKVGGMYGILPLDNEFTSPSFQITLCGFIKDVIVQMKRDLTGFWVAHPDFVRLGLALVEAWKLHKDGNKEPLTALVKALLDKKYHKEILGLISAKDIEGLNASDPNYVRSLIVADIKESDFIANNAPEEIRYNVFQSLQYLTDWLAGNGCVALPAIVNGVPVRVMDDLATAERSRWEVWHELRHGRFKMDAFLQIVQEEMHFIRKDLSSHTKIVQVKFTEKTEKWYPVALNIMLQLMTAKTPPEFATELLMPFTVEKIREAADPWQAACAIDAKKFQLPDFVRKFNYYFTACGCRKFANEMAKNAALDLSLAEKSIHAFSLQEIKEAASFHGDIGESKKTLDTNAKLEQARILSEGESDRQELASLGQRYKAKFGVKFLISAKDKTSGEILQALKKRLKNTPRQERENSAKALAEIALKRMRAQKLDSLSEKIEEVRARYHVNSAAVALNLNGHTQSLSFGEAKAGNWFQLASLSKPVATAICLEFFRKKKIPLDTSVNQLLAKARSKFRLQCKSKENWADQVQIEHLLNHSALNLHYVTGNKAGTPLRIADRLKEVEVISEPGKDFHYSGGGFLVLEHLLEALTKKPAAAFVDQELKSMGLKNLSFSHKSRAGVRYASGYFDTQEKAPRLHFPGFAAGATGDASDLAKFLNLLTTAYGDLKGAKGISHDTAVEMLHGIDRGSGEFMGAAMGLGIFVADAGPNKIAIHQGANEGFRSLFIQCFSGPDTGKGFVIFCNADNRGVLFIAQAAQEILRELGMGGVDLEKCKSLFSYDGLAQEQIVNLGYKEMIFSAFSPALPEAVPPSKRVDPLAEFNLAAKAKILGVSNQRFARAENLLSIFEPAFDPTTFGAQGKIMDSWESARHNPHACDHIVLELPKAEVIRYVSLSTRFHDGNQAEYVRILGRLRAKDPWQEILPKQQLHGHSLLQLEVPDPSHTYSQIRVEMFPDGGLTRLGIFAKLPSHIVGKFKRMGEAQSVRFTDEIPKTHKPLVISYAAVKGEIQRNLKRSKKSPINFASLAFGGRLAKATNEHYGPAVQVVSPYPPIHMFDGLESARSREAGHMEEVHLQLGKAIAIGRIVFDFTYFVNNNPQAIRVDGLVKGKWVELVGKTRVKAFAANKREFFISNKAKIELVRVLTFPDGGINRIQVFEK